MSVNELSNGNTSAHDNEPLDPLAEAELLRTQLHEAFLQAGKLMSILKHQRRENRAVQAAMESLRRLRPLDR
jgi:hypothetical protein